MVVAVVVVEVVVLSYGKLKELYVIAVFLYNDSDQDQTCSATFKADSAVPVKSRGWDRVKVKAKYEWGYSKFLSYGAYKKWAKENGDVFKLEVSVSLLTKEIVATDIDCWTR